MSNGTQTWRRRGVLRALGAIGSLAAAGVTVAEPGREPGRKPNELIVGAKEGASTADVTNDVSVSTAASTSVVHENDTLGYVAVELPEAASETARASTRSTLENRPNVEYVEENATYEIQLTPNDPRFGDQYAPQQVNAEAAWDTTLGSTDVTVAVIDTGADYTHEDLSELFASNPGRDFVDDDGDPAPSGAVHGTHVSGCASANTNNGIGVAGVSDSRLLSARALGGGGGGSLSDIADAVQWAADQGADIINMSLGGGGATETMRRAVDYAYNQNDVLIVCAAGNDGGSVSYPAAYPQCVAVSALDPDQNLASFSNRGPEIEVAAPGVNVLSTVPDGYDSLSGTSMASPVAAGVAALGKAADPSLSASELRDRLKSTADGVGLPSEQQGSGRVDAADIVGAGGSPPDNEAPSANAQADPTDPNVGETVTFDGTGSSDPDGSIASYSWEFGDGTTASGATVEHSYSEAGEYQATLTVTDNDGASTTDGVNVAVSEDGGGGDCSQSASGSANGTLYGYYDGDQYTWTSRFGTTCEVTVDLSGPSSADFDLYVTADGRTPTTSDYDARSISGDSSESVTLSSVGDSVGILVDSYSGWGSYTVSVTETGSGAQATTATVSSGEATSISTDSSGPAAEPADD